VSNLTALGKTVLLTTHYMDEAQMLADRVIVIARGAIVAEGTPEDIGGRDLDKTIVSFAAPADLLGATRDLHRLTSWAVERGVLLDGLDVRKPSLEDVYLRLTADPTSEVTA
jgi:ABC-2 type transport system ATP-binding protein